ncbi:MAG: hypothetical protein R2754_04430 [Microthrixaceae bacterium]
MHRRVTSRRRGAVTVATTLAVTLAVALLGAACTDTSSQAGDTTEPSGKPGPALETSELQALSRIAEQPQGCDPIDLTRCLLPFPSDALTRSDDSGKVDESSDEATGRLVNLPADGTPANADGVHVDPTEWNRNDGFSPNTPILAYFPNIDLERMGAATEATIGASMSTDSPTLLFDLTEGTQVPHWVEVDARAEDPADQLTIMRPAVSLPEGHHFAVAYREVLDDRGRSIPPSAGFRAIRDGVDLAEAELSDEAASALDGRADQLAPVLEALGDEGVNVSELVMAWDFTVASTTSLSGRLLAMRDATLKHLENDPVQVTVTDTVENPKELPEGIGRKVSGTFTLPLFLAGDGTPGTAMNYGKDKATPAATGKDFAANFTCMLTNAQLGNAVGGKARAVVYGHGLLGSRSEVAGDDLGRNAASTNQMYCATDWLGMSEADIPYAIEALGDLSKFPAMADRMQQGILAQLVLARALIDPRSFPQLRQFTGRDGGVSYFTDEVYFDGNSQGGIMGAAATAVATDWKRATLGVPGMNYSTLLQRSTDWDTYSQVMDPAYPDAVDRQILFGLLQMLWDRGEAGGYIQHLTDDPYPNTPKHQVIFAVAFGDHQVAPITVENMARTLGIGYHQPALAEGRDPREEPLWDLDPIGQYPADGSALFYWDSGAMAPPLGNVNPTMGEEWEAACGADEEAEGCPDPHEDPRRALGFVQQKQAFFETGTIIDPCGGEPCRAEPT